VSCEKAKDTSYERRESVEESEEEEKKATSPNFEGSMVLDLASSSAVRDVTPFLEASIRVSTT
jgi:hypothetical protein